MPIENLGSGEGGGSLSHLEIKKVVKGDQVITDQAEIDSLLFSVATEGERNEAHTAILTRAAVYGADSLVLNSLEAGGNRADAALFTYRQPGDRE